MTVRTNAVQTCDRCLKPFNEKHLKAGDEVPIFKQTGLVITKITGTNKEPDPKADMVLSFDDMCPDCQSAVDNLVAKIRLDGSKPKKVAKKRGSKKKKSEIAPPSPSVQTYSEEQPAVKASDSDESAKGESKEAEEPKTDADADVEKAEKAPETDTSEQVQVEEATEGSEANSGTEGDGSEVEAGSDEDSGVDEEAGSDDDDLVTDPMTGDVYDRMTGEVIRKGNSGESEKHPF